MLYEVITLEVAGQLKNGVYDCFKTVVMTSATLAVGESFAYFAHRVGLDRSEPGRTIELLRITSYNVCYTKLLRHSAGLFRLLDRFATNSGTGIAAPKSVKSPLKATSTRRQNSKPPLR